MADVVLETLPSVKATKLGFLSQDGTTQVKAVMWAPSASKDLSPKGIIQIAHGMEEHIGRYVAFANFLASAGFVVCAADMVGHGRSVTAPEKIGCIPLARGMDILVEDANELRKTTSARFSRQTPYFVFGHSMGSFLMRAYVARYGDGLAGAVFSGTGQQPVVVSRLGNALAKAIAHSKGEDYKSKLLEDLTVGAFSKQIENARTPLDWLCTDEAVVDAYIADPWCGVPFSVGGHAALTGLTAQVATASNAAKTPEGLPVLFISGALDPVGSNGAGVESAANQLRHAGVKQVDVTLYPGMRHEVLNEPGKQQVYDDIVTWIESVLGGQ